MTRLLSSAGNPHQCCRWCRRSPRESVSFPPPLLSPASPSSDRFRRCRTSFSSWAGTCSPGTPSGGAASTSRPPRGKLPSPLPQEASTVSPDSAKKSCQIMLKTCDQMSQISPFFAWTILEPCYLYIGKTLEISALCESGFWAMILRLRTVCHTMNAFIGLFTWFGGCFFVCNMVFVVTCEQIIQIFWKTMQAQFR